MRLSISGNSSSKCDKSSLYDTSEGHSILTYHTYVWWEYFLIWIVINTQIRIPEIQSSRSIRPFHISQLFTKKASREKTEEMARIVTNCLMFHCELEKAKDKLVIMYFCHCPCTVLGNCNNCNKFKEVSKIYGKSAYFLKLNINMFEDCKYLAQKYQVYETPMFLLIRKNVQLKSEHNPHKLKKCLENEILHWNKSKCVWNFFRVE